MTTILIVASLAWAIYHAGIEEGRKRASRQGQNYPSVITRIREWHR